MSAGGQESEAARLLPSLKGKYICPFCGTVRAQKDEPCPRCTMRDTPETRQATRNRIGPWYVLQSRNPSAPGMKFETLLLLVRRGQVTPRSIVRGPTTHQFWRLGARVRGLSREWGLCQSCGGNVGPTDKVCAHCHKSLEPPSDPDVLLEIVQPAAFAPIRRSITAAPVTASTQMVLPTLGQISTTPAIKEPIPDTTPVARQDVSPAPPAPVAPAAVPEVEPQAAEPSHSGSLLSPQDLAAAFSLDFKGREKTRGRTRSSWRRRSRIGQWAALLIAIGILSGVTLLSMRPDLRQRLYEPVAAYIGRYIHSENDAHGPADAQDISLPGRAAGVPTLPNKASDGDSPTPRPLSLDNLPMPSAPGARQSTQSGPVAQEPASPKQETPANKWSHVPVDESASSSSPAKQPETAGSQSSQKQAVSNDGKLPKSSPPVDPLQHIRQLWVDAITAEGKGDFNSAIRMYEQIQAYPREFWPGGLELRLRQAKEHQK